MKQKRKGHLSLWLRPLLWGNNKTSRIIWLNLLVGMLMAGIGIFLLSPTNVQSLELNGFVLSMLFLVVLGFYLSIGSAFLIFWGYAEDEEL